MSDAPDQGPGAFSVQVVHDVLFKVMDTVPVTGAPNPGGLPSMLQTQVGARIDSTFWKGAWTDIVWSVKWGPNGLTPIRPHVLVTSPLSLLIQKAVLLK